MLLRELLSTIGRPRFLLAITIVCLLLVLLVGVNRPLVIPDAYAQSAHQVTFQPGNIIKLGFYSFIQLDTTGTLMAMESVFLCPTGSYVSGGNCQLCSDGLDNCLACASATQCHTCNPGYHLENFICVPDCDQVANCNTCRSPQICSPTGCLSGYLITPSGQCETCAMLHTYCLTCSGDGSSATCDTCATGYYPNGIACIACTNTLDHCTSCSSSTTCLTCEIGYHLDGNVCVPDCSVTNCNTCSSPDYCSDIPGSCSAGYYSDGGGCLLCSTVITGCSECSDSSTCTVCRPGYMLEANGACVPTGSVNDCAQYSDPDVCDTCNLGYYLDANTCSACNTTISSCSACTYASASATLTCDTCDLGYSLDFVTNTCVMNCNPTGDNCNTCSSPNYCSPTGCDLGYFSTGGTCAPCFSTLSHCTSCADGTTCLTCEAGYHVEGGVCVLDCNPTGGNCNTCDTPDHCAPTGCDSGYFSNNGVCEMNCSVANCASSSSCYGPNQCGTCNPGYYPNLTNGQCNACSVMTGCAQCADASTCTVCASGYYHDNGICNSCLATLQGCDQCSNSSTCTTCQPGYILEVDGTCTPTGSDPACNVYTSPDVCSPTGCNTGYYNDAGICATCATSCSDCSNSASCHTCTSGFYLNGAACASCSAALTGCTSCTNGSTCATCATGYNLENGLCVPTGSVDNCSAYFIPNQCSTCNTGFYLDSNSCASCSATLTNDCLACSSAGNCTSCDDNTILQDGECHTCSSAVTNCISCDGTACTGCAPSYYLDGGTCSLCFTTITGCDQCSNSSTCTTCKPGYILETDGTCTPTGTTPNCTTYSNPDVCSACATGYTLDSLSNTCVMDCTTPNCNTCDSPNHCGPTGCVSGYYTDGGTCASCSAILTGCITCTDGATCTSCDIGYVLDDNICRPIPAAPTNLTLPPEIYNAATVFASWDPVANATGYLLERSCNSGEWTQVYHGSSPSAVNDLSDCEEPVQFRVKAYNTLATISSPYTTSTPQNYMTCAATSNCSKCTDASTCVECAGGYAFSGSACIPTGTDPNCVTYSAPGICFVCVSGYKLSNDSCVPTGTDPNCVTYSAPDVCATCKSGYLKSGATCVSAGSVVTGCTASDGSACTACGSGRYLSSGSCPACPTGCTSCTSASACQTCSSGYLKSGNTCAPAGNVVAGCIASNGSACTTCSSGHYLSSGSCPACPTGCTSCTSASVCQTCASGYLKSGNTCAVASSVVAGCATSDGTTCTTCSGSYRIYEKCCCILVPNPHPPCFLAGTKISMADGSAKNIEEVVVGEQVLAYNQQSGRNAIDVVLQVSKMLSDHHYVLRFADGTEVKTTQDHPFLTQDGWKSMNPRVTNDINNHRVGQLAIGDEILRQDGFWVTLVETKKVMGEVTVYNLSEVESYHTFFANGMCVHNKVLNTGPTYRCANGKNYRSSTIATCPN